MGHNYSFVVPTIQLLSYCIIVVDNDKQKLDIDTYINFKTVVVQELLEPLYSTHLHIGCYGVEYS